MAGNLRGVEGESTRDGVKNPLALFLWKSNQSAEAVKFE
jgi:hypothetical protein